MNCAEIGNLIHAYADDELDLVHAREVQTHLANCAACNRAYENIRKLKTALKPNELNFRAPAGLKRQIRASVKSGEPRQASNPFAWWRMFRVAIPVAGAALLAVVLIPGLIGQSATDRLAGEVTASHVRSLMVNHQTDVASSDQHTVKPWFDGKLDFAPPVVDLAEHGFPLVGGRLDYLHERPVAALVYQRHKHFINLFIWPASSDSKSQPKTAVRQGYNLIHWNASGMTYWAISDLNQAELKQFTELLNK